MFTPRLCRLLNKMNKRPNILLITSDQQRADCFGFENPRIGTPHIDRLARQGTRFSACITPNLVCQPSRASILTGLLPLTHGVWDNGIDLDPAVGEQGFAGTLARAGYQTAVIGKAHFSTKATFAPTGTPECKGSGAHYGDRWRGPYMGFGHVELTVLGHFDNPCPLERPPVGHYERWLLARAPGDEVERLYREPLAPGAGAAQTWHSALPAAWHSSTWIADRAIRWLSGRKADAPFCAWVSFPDPHQPFDCPAPWSFQYDPKDVALPAHRTRDLERRPWWYRATLEGTPRLADPEMRGLRAKVSRIPDQNDAQLAEMTANYYGMISLIDHNVGRILAALDDLGGSGETLVIFTTDHGEMLGHHGLYLKGPWPLEDLLRVGLVVSGPGIAAARVVGEPVSTLDLAATFYDYAGTAAPREIQSRSLRLMLEGRDDARDVAYSEWRVHPSRCGVALELRTVRTRRYKCTLELDSGAGELYDLESDPRELVNLFDDAGYARLRGEMEGRIRARPGTVRGDLSEPVGMA
jgi:arylsulfatase A-like enzyme